jgi:ribosome maturation factor RimP
MVPAQACKSEPGWLLLSPIRGARTSGRKAHFIFGASLVSLRWKPLGSVERCSWRNGSATEAGRRFDGVMADVEKIRGIAGRVAGTYGVELVELELKGGGKARTLKITIDKPEGITHEDCANVSREVSTILDVEDAVAGGSYTLEVSSPGLDRKLLKAEDYQRFAGSRVKLMTREPVNGNRHFEGRLENFQDGKLTLETMTGKKKPKPGHAQTGQKIQIELANVERANVVPEI